MRDHPSRAIVVRVLDSAKPELEARVFAQCWMPLGQRRQICCEQIEISSSNVSLSDLPPCAAARRGGPARDSLVGFPRLFATPALINLSRLATKTIVDSAASPIRSPAPPACERIRLRRLCWADLAWTRLTRWRELIAQIFENPCYSSTSGNRLGDDSSWRNRSSHGPHTWPPGFAARWSAPEAGRKAAWKWQRGPATSV